MRKPGGLFGNTGSEIPVTDLKQLETFFYKLGFFLHILDYTGLLKMSFVLLSRFSGHNISWHWNFLLLLLRIPRTTVKYQVLAFFILLCEKLIMDKTYFQIY